jgi:hypothetical protein
MLADTCPALNALQFKLLTNCISPTILKRSETVTLLVMCW